MKIRNVVYIIILIICAIAIALGVYAQLFSEDNETMPAPIIQGSDNQTDENDDVSEQKKFNDLFENKIYIGEYDTSTVDKTDSTKEIVYTAYDIIQDEENKYEVEIHVPVVNIKGEIADKFNETTQKVFVDKASEVFANPIPKTIYNINYIAYINEDILSMVIQSSLKEGTSAQRVMVETYNYNLKTGQEVTLEEVLEENGYQKNSVTKKIKEYVKEANKESQALANSGYSVFTRDLDNSMYEVENVSNWFMGENGQVYIVYAYGNQNFTSALDVIML